MKQRDIIHVDMDCFYASIEMRDEPKLQDKPVRDPFSDECPTSHKTLP